MTRNNNVYYACFFFRIIRSNEYTNLKQILELKKCISATKCESLVPLN